MQTLCSRWRVLYSRFAPGFPPKGPRQSTEETERPIDMKAVCGLWCCGQRPLQDVCYCHSGVLCCVFSTVCSVLCFVCCVFYTVCSVLRVLHCVFCVVCCVLCVVCSILCVLCCMFSSMCCVFSTVCCVFSSTC